VKMPVKSVHRSYSHDPITSSRQDDPREDPEWE
jgi:hypothetical protein